jgi:hypothetical protein
MKPSRALGRGSWVALAMLIGACSKAKPPASPAEAAHGPAVAKARGYDLVMQATSCWMGGLWSDALGEAGKDRPAGIDRRCNELLRDIDITARERERAIADRVPPPAPEEAYYPLRAVEPHVVDAIAQELATRAQHDPAEAPHGGELVTLLRAVAAATRETIQARRAADVVKDDVLGQPSVTARNADKEAAAAKLQAGEALDTLWRADAGPYTAEAHAVGLLSALDRMEVARGLPKHLKTSAVGAAYADVFGVPAPTVPKDAAAPIRTGTWLKYLADVAAAAGHPVPGDARDPQNREPLAWTGVLEGFADRLRADAARFPAGTRLGDVERGVVARLDDEYRNERTVYEAHAPAAR